MHKCNKWQTQKSGMYNLNKWSNLSTAWTAPTSGTVTLSYGCCSNPKGSPGLLDLACQSWNYFAKYSSYTKMKCSINERQWNGRQIICWQVRKPGHRPVAKDAAYSILCINKRLSNIVLLIPDISISLSWLSIPLFLLRKIKDIFLKIHRILWHDQHQTTLLLLWK